MPNANEYTELIYDFLDGDLPQGEETRLFAALLHDADVRTEFKQALLINTTIQNDTQAFTPSPRSDEAIFTRLGFSNAEQAIAPIPLPPIANTGAPSMMSRLLPTLRRVGLVALIMLLSSGLTAWFLGNRWGGSNYGQSGNTALLFKDDGDGGNNRNLPPNSSSNLAGSGFLQTHSAADTVYADTLYRTRTVIERVFVMQGNSLSANTASKLASQNVESTNENTYGQSYSTVKAPQETLKASQTENRPTFLRDSSATASTPTTTVNEKPVQQAFTPLWGVSVGARGIVARSLIWANISPASEAFPTNTALFALYNINAQHSIGMEFGQESFFQRFFYADERGVEYRVEQHPTLLWGGLAYRFMLLPEQTFSPFAHIVLGATQVSAMGRGMIGLTYKPDVRTQFLLGAEASSLFFQSGGMLYMAPKLGISYGVSVTF